ncbi:MAG: hypothetical protein V3U82_05835 [Robiginitomaculum sp.]
MVKGIKISLRRDLRESAADLAALNSELALGMMELAAQTGDVAPLIEAVRSLAKANNFYTQEETPISHGEIQKALGDSLLKLGRNEGHTQALEHAAIAYKGAITVASMLGDAALRRAAKKNYTTVMSLLGRREKPISVISAA